MKTVADISLAALQKRIEETDLIPSRAALRQDIAHKFRRLRAGGINTLADLRKRLKTPAEQTALAADTGLETAYLVLLRREIESYSPKALPLGAFAWLPPPAGRKLAKAGYNNSHSLCAACAAPQRRRQISAELGIEPALLETLFQLADLTRLPWVSPLTARLLQAAGYTSPQKIARATAAELCAAVERVNRENGFFKGKIGSRDMQRLIDSTRYV